MPRMPRTTRSVTALPYERVLVSVPVQAESIGAGTEKGMIQFEVVAEAPGYKDGLFHELPVYPESGGPLFHLLRHLNV